MNVLAIDGGGILGLIPALILAEIEERIGRPAAEVFGLAAGTSTGGIIACAVAAGLQARTVVELYRSRGREIFSRSVAHRLASGFGLFGPQYGAEGLEAALADVFGERRLSGTVTEMLVPAYDIEARRPVFFSRAKALERPRRDYLLRDVCRATAAAPTYFPPARLAGPGGGEVLALVDGGLAANNPSACALAETAKRGLWPGLVLSLGTGSSERPYLLRQARRWGLARWARPLIDCMFDAQSDAAAYQCGVILGRDRYCRWQTALPPGLSMDDASARAIETIEAVARGWLSEHEAEVEAVCERLRE